MRCIVILILGFLFSSCVNDSSKTVSKIPEQVSQAVKKREATSELAASLYANFHENPTTQAQKDENALIDYAVDKNLDVKKTASGLYYIIHEQGTGPLLLHNQPTKAHYTGYTLDGKIFDSSHKRGKPLAFSVGQMVPGWNEALKMMNTGTKAKLLLPSHLAYGTRGFPGLIEPNAPLVFDLEIMPLVDKH